LAAALDRLMCVLRLRAGARAQDEDFS